MIETRTEEIGDGATRHEVWVDGRLFGWTLDGRTGYRVGKAAKACQDRASGSSDGQTEGNHKPLDKPAQED